jgi:hypothetical protein
MSNWQQREGFRREVHPYSLADRMRHGGAPTAVADPTRQNEWRQLREALQPCPVCVGTSPKTWPLYKVTYTCSEDQLSEWSLSGIAGLMGTTLTIELRDDEETPGTYTLRLWNGETELCRGTRTGDGTVSLSAVDGSGVSGSVELAYTGNIEAGDLEIEAEALDPIEEDEGGTYYTPWIELDDGPIALGFFGLPEFTIASDLDEEESDSGVTVDAEFYDDEGETETVYLGTLWSDGDATRVGSGDLLFRLDEGKLVKKMRFKVVADAGLVWTLGGNLLTFYARA